MKEIIKKNAMWKKLWAALHGFAIEYVEQLESTRVKETQQMEVWCRFVKVYNNNMIA